MNGPTKSGRRVVTKDHVLEALTAYLISLSVINDDEAVTSFYAVPEGLDVRIEHD